MFGTLRPHRCSIDNEVHAEHRRYYCGTCRSLGNEYSLPERALLSYDAVFLSTLGDALMRQEPTRSQCRCPMVPVVHRDIVAESPALRYSAAVQYLLADQLVADRAVDGSRMAAMARPLLQRRVAHAQSILDELGIDLSELDGFELHQKAAEEDDGATLESVLAPTADALALVIGKMADLPGCVDLDEVARADLERLGWLVGAVIYIVDALEDLRKDYLTGDFNVLVAPGSSLCSARVNDACAVLQSHLAELTEILARLPLQRARAVLANVLEDRLSLSARKAMRKARGFVVAERARATPRPTGLAAVWARAVTFVLTTWAAMLLFKDRAFGQDDGDKGGTGDGDGNESGDGTAEADGTAEGDGTAESSDGNQSTEGDGSGADGAGPGEGRSKDGKIEAGDPPTVNKDGKPIEGDGSGDGTDPELPDTDGLESCADVIDAINDCIRTCFELPGKCCEDCTKPCTDCGNSCTGCLDGCSDCMRCDCGNCCDGCGDCGNCCDGCNDCGNCGNCCDGCNDCGNCGNCCG